MRHVVCLSRGSNWSLRYNYQLSSRFYAFLVCSGTQARETFAIIIPIELVLEIEQSIEVELQYGPTLYDNFGVKI